MKSNFYPPEGHDFVGTAEIRVLEAANRIHEEACFLGGLAVFRADVFTLLSRTSNLGRSSTFAAFQYNHDAEPDAGVSGGVNQQLFTDVLLGLIYPDNIKTKRPTIRVITNELVSRNEVGKSYLIEDVTLDFEDDCQYLADFATTSEEGHLVNKPQGAYFFANGGKIKFAGQSFLGFTRVLDIPTGIGSNRVIMPFGHYRNLADKIYAFEKAKGIVEKLKDLKPLVVNVDGEIVSN